MTKKYCPVRRRLADIHEKTNCECLLRLCHSIQESVEHSSGSANGKDAVNVYPEEKFLKPTVIQNYSKICWIKFADSGSFCENTNMKNQYVINDIGSREKNISRKGNRPPGKEEQPPTPPPRVNANFCIPPSLPPPPPAYLKAANSSKNIETCRCAFVQMQQNRGRCGDDLNGQINQLLIHHLQILNLRESPSKGVHSDCRNSPSSGFYSCSPSASSSSPTFNGPCNQTYISSANDAYQAKAPIIMHSIKSTRVEKPQLQTAIAPDGYVPPPPYKNCTVQRQDLYNMPQLCYTSPIPTTPPPSYASSVQSLIAQNNSDFSISSCNVVHDFGNLFSGSCCSPDLCAISEKRIQTLTSQVHCEPNSHNTNKNAALSFDTKIMNEDDQNEPKVEHQSPIPQRKRFDAEKENVRKDCKIRNYSPQAFKFFMEQHIENVIKSHKQRVVRRLQLETEMIKIGLSAEAQRQMRKMLCQKESNYIRLKRAKMDKSMFERIKLIGVGAFGEVTLVRKIDTRQLYAMKTLRKADVLKKNQVAHVKAERDILAEADNEWVVKLYFSFQDVDNLYFVMEYIPGGDLMSLLIKFGIFEEDLARFYLAELTCAVESVHKIGFIHRDIKPDNILIDRDGHIKLTDFGLCTGFRWTHNSKYYENENHSRQDSLDVFEKWSTNDLNCKCSKLKPLERRRRREHQRCLAHSLVGTPNYIAPEVLLRTGYTQLCDWWSVGVVLYEMLIGSPPFSADSPIETQYKIIGWQDHLKIPNNANISAEAIDLILKLCTSPDRRLGKNVNEIKEHSFLSSVDFKKGVRYLTPPYIPKILFATDTSNFDPIHTESMASSDTSGGSSLSSETASEPFHGFFEFTFRRFFDDGSGVPFATKPVNEKRDPPGAIFV